MIHRFQRICSITLAGVLLATMLVASPTATAATIADLQKPYLEAVDAFRAQQITKGQGVVVAILDTGYDAGHPDLAGAFLPGAAFLNAPTAYLQTDPIGHGTFMSGIIAARGGGANNALGIAPGAMLLPVAIPVGEIGSTGEAIRWTVDHGARVINLSLARDTIPSGEAEAIAYAQSKDVVVVVSMGNTKDLTSDNPLAKLPGVVAVTGLDEFGNAWSGSLHGDHAAIAAQSTKIVNVGARNLHSTGFSVGEGGTSESAAIVSGTVALIRAKYPTMDAANVINRLIKTATDKGAPGRDDLYGFGAVNAYAALTAEVSPVTSNPLGVAKTAETPQNSATTNSDVTTDIPASTSPLVFIIPAIVLLLIIGAIVWIIRSRRRKAATGVVNASSPAGPLPSSPGEAPSLPPQTIQPTQPPAAPPTQPPVYPPQDPRFPSQRG